VNDKQSLSSEQIQAKLKNLQTSASHKAAENTDIEITVASQREAFNLKACQALLEEHGISSKLVGHGFNQVVVVSREDSGRSIDVIAVHRHSLVQAIPFTANDYVVGILAWAVGCGLLFPVAGLTILMFIGLGELGFDTSALVIGVAVLIIGSALLGGGLGYLRCRAIASRRR
jgi:hypothetical protein